MSSVYPSNLAPCAFCGASFVPHKRAQRFCSRSCAVSCRMATVRKPPEHHAERGRVRSYRYATALVTKTCIECGRSFVEPRGRKGICSESCKKARRSRFRPQTYLLCEQCRQPFGPVDHRRKRFCSRACMYVARIGQPTSSRGKHYPHLQRARIGTCLTCGAQFRATKDFQRRQQLYCSHHCYLINRRVSHFEERVGAALEIAGVVLERQKRIKRWVIDFAMPGTMLLVEADGSYWHASAEVQARDGRKTRGLTAMGYELFRVDEMDFRRRGAATLLPIVQRWQDLTGKAAVREQIADDARVLTG